MFIDGSVNRDTPLGSSGKAKLDCLRDLPWWTVVVIEFFNENTPRMSSCFLYWR